MILANDWEQRKFGELYRKVSRKNDLTYGETDIISVANMYYKEDSYITDDSYLLTYNVFHLGDIAFEGNKSKDFAHGRFVENTIGNGIVSHVFDVFEPIMSKYDLMFWKYAINNERLMGPILVRATKASTMMTNLVADDFLQEKFLVPSYEEQKEIGELLLRIDNLITLHQCKEILIHNEYDSSSLFRLQYKMANAWEQRKLGELCEKFADGDWIEAKDQSGYGIRLIQTGNIGLGEYLDKPNNKKWVSEDTFNRLHCEEVFTGDILISRLPEPAGRACIVPNLGTKMITAVDCTIVRTSAKVSKKFLLQHLSSKKYFDEVNTCMAGGTRQRISRSNLANFNVLIPISFDEQESIGRVLCGLDNLITLHQCKRVAFMSRKSSSIFQFEKWRNTLTWEQRKVQDVAERYDNLRVPVAANLRVHGNIPYYGANGIQDYVDGFTHDGEFVLVAEDGANDLKNYPVQHVKGRIWVNNHAHVLQGKPNLMDNLFLAYSLHRADIASYLVGGSRAKLNADTLMTLELLLPGVEEQTKIGRLLDSIDNLITLHQRGEKIYNRRQTW